MSDSLDQEKQEMKLIGQRWEFQIGNTVIYVDNAYSWTLWGQERMLVNGEQVHASSGRMRFSQKYQEPWLTPFGDGELKVWLRSTTTKLRCSISLEGEPIPASAIFSINWQGPVGSWPKEEEWERRPPGGAWAFD
jgi:hypothetical protein